MRTLYRTVFNYVLFCTSPALVYLKYVGLTRNYPQNRGDSMISGFPEPLTVAGLNKLDEVRPKILVLTSDFSSV